MIIEKFMDNDFDNYSWRDNENAIIVGINETMQFSHNGVHLKFKYPPKTFIDLHSMSLDDAAELLHNTLLNCYQASIRELKVIHGKGKAARLKSAVFSWLQKHPLVLGFCSAPNYDGGSGCVYVLIRRFK